MPKIITREFIEKIRAEKNIIWSISDHKRKDKNNRYQYLCFCRCGASRWIGWGKLYTGSTKGCRSCSKQSSQTANRRNHPLKQIWYGIVKRSKFGRAENHFRGYNHFRDWALLGDWVIGSILKRKQNTGPYSSTNCYWEKAGVSYRSIAKDLGVSAPAIRYWLKKGLSLQDVKNKFKERS